MGYQRSIAKKIIEKKADYILAVKGNQGTLERAVLDTIKFCKPIDVSKNLDLGHE